MVVVVVGASVVVVVVGSVVVVAVGFVVGVVDGAGWLGKPENGAVVVVVDFFAWRCWLAATVYRYTSIGSGAGVVVVDTETLGDGVVASVRRGDVRRETWMPRT